MSQAEKLTDDEVRDRFLLSIDDAARWQYIRSATSRGEIQQIVSLVANYCDADLDAKMDELRKKYAGKRRVR